MQKKGRKQDKEEPFESAAARNVMDFNKHWEEQMKEVSEMADVQMCVAVEILARVLRQPAVWQEET